MSRYIDADEVKKAIEESWDGCLGSYDSHEITMNDLWVIDRVQTADVVEVEGSKVYKCLSYTTTGIPTADVRENVHAHWEGDGQCSNCKGYPLARYMKNPNFCPSCGAQMDEEDLEATEDWYRDEWRDEWDERREDG